MKLLKGTWILKLAALVCAIATYFYITNELYQDRSRLTDPSYKLIKLTAKNLPLKARFASDPPAGYKLLIDGVKTQPSRVTVIGPEALLDEAFNAETALIDLSENTGTVVRKIPLESVAGIHLTGEPHLVEVTVPIQKIEEKK